MRLINSAADSALNKNREILKALYFRHLQNQKLRHEPSGTVLAGLVLFVAYGIHTIYDYEHLAIEESFKKVIYIGDFSGLYFGLVYLVF